MSTRHQVADPRFMEMIADEVALVTSTDNKIYKVQLREEKIELFAGGAQKRNSGGTPTQTQFNFPAGLAIDDKDNYCYLADQFNHRLCRIKFV